MCRVDDDWDYTIESETLTVASAATACEDCGRVIDEGEAYWDLAEMPADWEYDTELVYIATSPAAGAQLPYHIIRPIGQNDDDEAWCDAMEALGFEVDEDFDPRAEPEPGHRTWCAHCSAANAWLEKVCHQHTVLVAAQDIVDHSLDYTAGQLGADFMALVDMVKACWRPDGQLVDVDVVMAHTTAAIEHALAGGFIAH